MAQTIRELLIKIGLDSQAAINGMRAMDNSFLSLKNRAMLVVGVIGTIAGTMFAVAKSAAKVGVELYKTSIMLGMSTVELQRLRGVASLVEVDVGTLTSAIRFFSKTTGLAMQGGKEQLKAFHKAGITSFKDVNGHIKSQSQLLFEVAERVAHVKTIQEKAAIVAKLFGRGAGAEMIPFFAGGAKRIKEMEAIFDKFGYTLSENDIKNSRIFNWQLIELGMTTEGLKNKIGYALLPYLIKYGDIIIELIGQHRTLKGEIELFEQAAKYTFPTVTGYIENTIDHIKDLIQNLDTLWRKTDKFLQTKHFFKTAIAGAAYEEQMYEENIVAPLGKAFSSKAGKAGISIVGKYTGINPALEEMARTGDYTGGVKKGGMSEAARENIGKKTNEKKQVIINSNPTININVPLGTPAAQQDWFKKVMTDHTDDAIQKEVRNILLANPQYEGV